MLSTVIPEDRSELDVCESGTELNSFFVNTLAKSTLPEAALLSGYHSHSLSTAFFLGYQVAVRHLDPELKTDQFAAFCASESGVKSSRDFTTRLNAASSCVSGEKSHVMLMQSDLIDFLYVLANDDEGELVCVKVATRQAAVEALQTSKSQPFLIDVPHAPIALQNAPIEPGFLIRKAHQHCFKPFRYWEDVMVGLSFAGWMLKHLSESGVLQLEAVCQKLIKAYLNERFYYDLKNLVVIDEFIQLLVMLSKDLPAAEKQAWKKDSVLLSLGATTRQKVERKLRGELSL